MKVAGIRFDTTGGRGTVAIGAPPSGARESHLWHFPGSGVRAASGFPLSSLSTGAVRVIVDLQSSPAPSRRIWVRAIPQGGHILGAIPETPVEPHRWQSGRCEVSVNLDARALVAGGVDDHHAVWRWQWRRDKDTDIHDLDLSEHLLFVTISPPTDPWTDVPAAASVTRPWLAVLRQACRWGRGATTRHQAASRIVQSMFALGGARNGACLRYMGDLTTYVDPGMAPHWFDCERFLNDLDAGECLGLNCMETATIVVTLANLLGCTLAPCAIEGNCIDPYDLNRIQPLGLSSGQAPKQFRFHFVALEQIGTAVGADDLLYDASLMINAAGQRANTPVRFVLPDGIRLGATTTPVGTGAYFPQLIAAGSIKGCRTRTVEPPWVGAKPEQKHVGACPL